MTLRLCSLLYTSSAFGDDVVLARAYRVIVGVKRAGVGPVGDQKAHGATDVKKRQGFRMNK